MRRPERHQESSQDPARATDMLSDPDIYDKLILTYDDNGNRLTTGGTTSSTENISTTSNRINSATGGYVRTYSYDNAGNILGDGNNTYTFNNRGRMSVGANTTNGSTNYLYNAVGQLMEKSGSSSGTTILVYDEQGHLIGEYTSTGAQETIWMEDTPIAVLYGSGSSFTIYNIQTDHLNTPRKLTAASADNTTYWRWDPDTFGSAAPSATITYNLRYPGMYALTELNIFKNGFRDYEPMLGRYLESDPIGLAGGSYSTYAYAAGNPLSNIDPLGLDIMVVTGGIRDGSLNPFGHVGSAIEGYGMASYGNDTPAGSGVLDYLLSQNQLRDQQVTIIPTSPLQDLLAQQFVKNHPDMNGIGKVDNCAVRTNELLNAARISTTGYMFPGGVARDVASLPGTTTYFIPQNSPIPQPLLNVLYMYGHRHP